MSLFDRIRRWLRQGRISNVWEKLFNGAVTVTVSILTNKELMNAAFQIAMQLMLRKEMNSYAKTAEFNMQMNDWCEEHGYRNPSGSDLNAVREIAYAAARVYVETRGSVKLSCRQ